jgi:hypothetical protein
MKAVLQAGWLFTVAIGNFIVLIVAELAQIPEQVYRRSPLYTIFGRVPKLFHSRADIQYNNTTSSVILLSYNSSTR